MDGGMTIAAANAPSRRSAVRIARYESIEQVPRSTWDRFAPRDAVGLEAEYLRAVEVSRINDLHPYYLVGHLAGEAIGIAYGFSIDMDLTKLAGDDPPEIIDTVRAWKPGFMNLRLVEVGHLSCLGPTIQALPPHLPAFLAALADEVDEIARVEDADLGVVRDIPAARYGEFRLLEECGYRPVMGYPIARMGLGWDGFEGYVSALKSKKRNGVRKKQAKLRVPGIRVRIIEDYAPHAERLAELWGNVARRGDYEHDVLTPAYFAAMSRHLAGRSHVLAIERDGTIIAFGLALLGDEEYFAVSEGMDDGARDSYELYANLMFETLRDACALGKKTLNLGITAYDFKTSIGAELDPCVYFVKAFKEPACSGGFADLIERRIPQPENRHRAFADRDVSSRVQPREAEEGLRRFDDRRDPFLRHERYVRADVARAAGLYPFCPRFESAQEPTVHHGGRAVIMLGTNSYLGLATHPKVKEAARAALDRYGTGCSGSPLYNGTLDLHQQLARELARFMRKDDALVFSTGYQTNVGVVSTLVGRNDVVIMDERNHASLVDGARLGRARLVRYKHADTDSLRAALERHADAPKLVVTDSLFSMEGTVIDLPTTVRLVREYHARLMLDESHALGVMGPTGRGVAEQHGLLDEIDVVMGTFSKSFASMGGFVAGDRKVIDTLRHTARSHIFSASLPPASVAAVLASMRIVDEEPERRARVLENARYMAEGLRALGFQVDHHGSAIVPVFCGNELLAMAAFHKLFQDGVFVNPVTHPAVPRGQECLRISVMATHDESTLRRALGVFARARTRAWPRPAGSTVCHGDPDGRWSRAGGSRW
jgi:8-amino-7-oxononanoate synthase